MTHRAVMLNEMIEKMNIQKGGVYIDATWGRGGHSDAILSRLGLAGRLIVVDCDHQAIELAQARYRDDKRVHIVHQAFDQLQKTIETVGYVAQIDGVLFDLGVSSPQLDQADRGFSFQRNGPLDMRMDKRKKLSAAGWLNHATEKEMADVFFHLGDEKKAWKIAKAIGKQRQQKPFKTTHQLAELISQVKKHTSSHHPATKVFLAIRLYINQELESFKSALKQALFLLKQEGHILVISFHSLEDRLVKKFVRYQGVFDEIPMPLMPPTNCMRFACRPIFPSDIEIQKNPRARSAKLRVIEKLH